MSLPRVGSLMAVAVGGAFTGEEIKGGGRKPPVSGPAGAVAMV